MSKEDGRRKAGAQTRRRLIDATIEALATSGVPGVSLRAVSAAADANVAAVKYHFGSRDALISEVLEGAVKRVSVEQDARLSALEASTDPAPVRAWLEAWAGPLIAVIVSSAPADRRLARIVGHAVSDESGLAAKVRGLAAASDERVIRGLAQALAPADERELWLRLTVMISALAGLTGGTFDPLLAHAGARRDLEGRLLDILEAIARAPSSARG